MQFNIFAETVANFMDSFPPNIHIFHPTETETTALSIYPGVSVENELQTYGESWRMKGMEDRMICVND